MTACASLVTRWQQEAVILRARGAEREACALETVARELEDALAAEAAEVLTLAEAAEECGLTYSALEKQVRHGRLANAGTKGAPRVRRADLPRKARGPAGPDLASRVLASRRER